jgi:pyruvate kinase
MKRTKIVVTLGPASSSVEMIEEMVKMGADVCRINFSHGSYENALEEIKNIRTVNTKLGTHTAILADLQGPKLRIGKVENDGVELVEGKEIIITTTECIGTAERIYITYPQFPKDVKAGENILIDDGKILLNVIETNNEDEVKAIVSFGGILSSKKGVNLPNTKISLPCLTEKDLKDLHFALEQKVDWVGLSFVRSAKDIIELKNIIQKFNSDVRTKVIAKIEKPEAILDIDNIIFETDALMVARGDLGVEVPMQEVPVIQKMLVRKCLEAAKPVIIATQMMESMITNISPTRAEVNDVANSVMDGSDAVMLSAETSVGNHPAKVVEAMTKIIEHVEQTCYHYNRDTPLPNIDVHNDRYISNSICYAAAKMAESTKATAIITITHSGYTAFQLSSHRPQANIYVFTDNYNILTTLNLVWGVQGFYYDKHISTDETIADIKFVLKKTGFIKLNDLIINISSVPLNEKGKSNMIKLTAVD